jgi:hypothetical protein
MYLRVKHKLNKSIARYPIDIARYTMIRSIDHKTSRVNQHRFAILHSKYNYNSDGINTIRYRLHSIMFFRLFTLINVTLNEESFEQIRLRLNLKRKH